MRTLPVGQRREEWGNVSAVFRAALLCSISFPTLYRGTGGVAVFHHSCVLGKRILQKLNIFAKKTFMAWSI